MDDKDAGIIICKATSLFDSPSLMLSAYEGWLDYNLKLQARDGRVRVEISNFFTIISRGIKRKLNWDFLLLQIYMPTVVFKRNTIT